MINRQDDVQLFGAIFLMSIQNALRESDHYEFIQCIAINYLCECVLECICTSFFLEIRE